MQRWCARRLSSGLPAVLERGLASSRFQSVTPAIPDSAYSELEARRPQRRVEASTADEPVFRCQATDWFGASQAVGWWNVRSFLNEWSCGNVGFWRFSATMARIVLGEIGRRLHLVPRVEVMPHHRSARTRRDAPAALARAGLVGSDPLQGGDRADTRPDGPEQGPVLRSLRDAPSVARPFRSRPVWSGSSMRTPGSSFSSRATATSSTAWSAPGTAARASGFAGEPSTRGGERRLRPVAETPADKSR